MEAKKNIIANAKKQAKDKKSKPDQIVFNPEIDPQRNMNEAAEKHGVLAFGRMNPPTTGHAKLVDKVHDVAKEHNATHSVVLSHTQDSKKNPLSAEQKVKHAKRYFPNTNIEAASKDKPTIMHHAAAMAAKGVQHLHVVAGSDRVGEYEKLLHKYNGVEGSHGKYNFKSITVHSSGERDPDAEGTEGMSASKMREHVKHDDFKSFRKGVPSHVSDAHAKELFNDVKHNLKEDFAWVSFDEYESNQLDERVLTLQQRIRRAMQMHRLEPKLKQRREVAQRMMAGDKQLNRRARKAAIALLKKRVAGQRGVEYQTLSPSDKIQVDKMVDKKLAAVQKIAARLLPKIRAKEVKRLESFRNGAALKEQQDNVMLAIKIMESIEKKADVTGYAPDTLMEVYKRGLEDYQVNEQHTQEQWAFNRLNSFVAGGKAAELDRDLVIKEALKKGLRK